MIRKPSKMSLIWLTLFLLINTSRCSKLQSTFLFVGVFGRGILWNERQYQVNEQTQTQSGGTGVEGLVKSLNSLSPQYHGTILMAQQWAQEQGFSRNFSSERVVDINKYSRTTVARETETLIVGVATLAESVAELGNVYDGPNAITSIKKIANIMGNIAPVLGVLGAVASITTACLGFIDMGPSKELQMLRQISEKMDAQFVVVNQQFKALAASQEYSSCMNKFYESEMLIRSGIERVNAFVAKCSGDGKNCDAQVKLMLEFCNGGSCERAVKKFLLSTTDKTIFGCNPLEAFYNGNPLKQYYKGSTNYWALMTASTMQLVTMGMQVVSLHRALMLGKDVALDTMSEEFGKPFKTFTKKIEEESGRVMKWGNFKHNLFTAAGDYYRKDLLLIPCENLPDQIWNVLTENFGSRASIIVQCMNELYGTLNHAVTGGWTMTGAAPGQYNLWRLPGSNKIVNVAFIPREGTQIRTKGDIKSLGLVKEFLKRRANQDAMCDTAHRDFYKDFYRTAELAQDMVKGKGEHVEIIAVRWGNNFHAAIDPELRDKNILYYGAYPQGHWLVYGYQGNQ